MIEHAYIHIPFCLRKCKYCSFVSGENIENKEIYIKTLLKEIKKRYKNEKLKTLYFGGGTPSLLDVYDITNIIKCFNLDKNAEVTLETNPETVEKAKFEELYQSGINRISLGIQTFDNEILKLTGRKHTSQIAKNAIKTIKQAEFNNISIDLIYGLPNQSPEKFEDDLNEAKKLDIQHISTYGLKIEKGSYFYENPPENIADDEIQEKMYKLLCNSLSEFNHYEISNFALEGYNSRHNTAYWQNKEYYGFGLNASGYEKNVRYKNTSIFNEYIKNPFKREEEILLTREETIENEIFLALRLKQGVNINELNKKYKMDFMEKYGKIVEKYKNYGLLKCDNKSVFLTINGILLSNEIMSEFIN